MSIAEEPTGRAAGIAYKNLEGVGNPSALIELQRKPEDGLVGIVHGFLAPGEEVIFSFPVDMNLLGDYAQEWVVLTTQRCAGWEEVEDGFEPKFEFPLKKLQAARLRQLTGNHILLADTGSGWEEVVRSSNMTAWKLKPLLQVMQKAAEDGPAVLAHTEDIELKLPERNVCPTCGRIINPHLRVCTACMNKRRILGRMVKQLIPYKALVGFSLVLLLGEHVPGPPAADGEQGDYRPGAGAGQPEHGAGIQLLVPLSLRRPR